MQVGVLKQAISKAEKEELHQKALTRGSSSTGVFDNTHWKVDSYFTADFSYYWQGGCWPMALAVVSSTGYLYRLPNG